MKIIKPSPLVPSRSHRFLANVRRFTAVHFGLLLAATGFALPKTWDGSSNGNWNTAANWTGNVVPANGDDLIFPTTASRYVITNDFPNLRVNSITFDTGINFNYAIRGNPITLTNGIAAQQDSPGANTIAIIITNAASQTFNCLNAGASLTVSSNILLGATTLTVTGSGDTTLSGGISGTGGITKLGAGTLIFSGGGLNVYTGATRVEEGVLELDKSSATGFSGSLTIGDGVGGINADVVRYTANDCINTSVPIIINESGLLDLNGFTDLVGLLTLIGGDISTGTGTLYMGDNLTATSTSAGSSAVITGNLALGGSFRTFTVSNGPSATDLNISAAISGTGGITKEEAGRLSLFTSNSFSGALTVNDGVVRFLDGFAAGTTAGGVVLNGDSILELTGSINVGAEPLTNNSIGQPSGFSLSNLGGTNSWAGNVVLLTNTGVAVVTNSTLELSGAISGAGALTKLQPGTLVFSGGSLNNYTGATSVEEGVLELGKNTAIGSSASLTIGDGGGGVDADVVRYTADHGIDTSVPIIIKESGLLNLNGFDDSVGLLTLIGGDISTGTGTLTMAGNLTATSLSGNSASISGNLALGVANRTFTVTNGVQTSDLIIAAAISGTVGMTKAEAGTMRLASSNSFSGAVTVNDGALRLENNFAVGTTAGGVTVNGDAILELINGTHVGAETLTLNNNSGGATSALSVATANSNSWAGGVVLQQNAEVNVVTTGTLNLLGIISGAGTLTKADTGTLIYSGGSANTYTNTTTVNAGTLLLNKSVSNGSVQGALIIGDGAGGANADVVRLQTGLQLGNVRVTVNSSGLFDLNGIASDGFGSLTGSGNVTLGGAAIIFGGDNTSTVFSGVISETGGVNKIGAGTMTLSGNNTYTGTTTVNNGELIVDGSQPQSPVSVDASGTLGGTGTVGHVSVNASGNLSPGLSPGRLTTSNLSFTVTSKFWVELNGTAPGSGYDQLKVNGAVTKLDSARLNATLGFLSAISNSFTIIDNDGTDAVTNTFNGLSEGATVNISGTPFRISYVGGTGNDVVLTQLTATQQPLLNIQRNSQTNVVLSWATNFTGFTLEANTNLNTNVWAVVTNTPAVSGTNNVVTNVAIESGKFYRLRAP